MLVCKINCTATGRQLFCILKMTHSGIRFREEFRTEDPCHAHSDALTGRMDSVSFVQGGPVLLSTFWLASLQLHLPAMLLSSHAGFVNASNSQVSIPGSCMCMS